MLSFNCRRISYESLLTSNRASRLLCGIMSPKGRRTRLGSLVCWTYLAKPRTARPPRQKILGLDRQLPKSGDKISHDGFIDRLLQFYIVCSAFTLDRWRFNMRVVIVSYVADCESEIYFNFKHTHDTLVADAHHIIKLCEGLRPPRPVHAHQSLGCAHDQLDTTSD